MPKAGDTGLITIRAKADVCLEHGFYDPSRIQVDVEIWSTVPFGPEQERCHAQTVRFNAPLTDGLADEAYTVIEGTYEDYWKETGAEPPKFWRDALKRSVYGALHEFEKRAYYTAGSVALA